MEPLACWLQVAGVVDVDFLVVFVVCYPVLASYLIVNKAFVTKGKFPISI